MKLKTLERCVRPAKAPAREEGHRLHALQHVRRERRGAPRGTQHVRPVRVGVALSHLCRRGARHRARPVKSAAAMAESGKTRRCQVDIPSGCIRAELSDAARAGSCRSAQRSQRRPAGHDRGEARRALGARRRQPGHRPAAVILAGRARAIGVAVPTPTETRRCSVPAGTQGGTVLRLKGKGCRAWDRVAWRSADSDQCLDARVADRGAERLFRNWPGSRATRPSSMELVVQAQGSAGRVTWYAIEVQCRARPAGCCGRLAGGPNRTGGRRAGGRHPGLVRARSGRSRCARERSGRRARPAIPVADRDPRVPEVDWTTALAGRPRPPTDRPV